jgi:CheY-like chemotaxis protein
MRKDTPISAADARVLLVQPEHQDRRMYAKSLDDHGFRSVPVPAAVDALTVAPRVDIIVTDILLPGYLDGVELVTRFKTDEQTKGTPVIVLTWCAWQSERDRAHAAGCDVFLAKPCVPDALVTEIRRLLALYRLPKPHSAPAAHTPLVHNRRAS